MVSLDRVSARTVRADTWRWLLPLLSFAALAQGTNSSTPLQFQIDEGSVQNAFYQQGPVAAHLLLSSGIQPRVLVAFPAGNSGVGIWFEKSSQPVRWTLNKIEGTTAKDDRGRLMHGITASASIDQSLTVKDAVLSSVRVLRDYQILGTYPPDIKSIATVAGSTVTWSRPRFDGAAGYSVSITVDNGTVRNEAGKSLTLSPTHAGESMRVKITALTGETPLTPLGTDHLLNAKASDDLRTREVLTFLSYQEKFLAGSWRFDTYFGRDTLMSLRLLLPALQPDAVERGIMSVLQRLDANGEVAHEEDIGEFAVLRHRKENRSSSDAPIYDYKMIDDDFMLASLASAYLFEHAAGRTRADKFLAMVLPSGERVGDALVRNFSWVMKSAQPFAQKPEASKLIALKAGVNVGEWRDSENGLAGGRYPFDVNAALVPAAVSAIQKIVSSGVLKPYLNGEQQRMLSTASQVAKIWSEKAPSLFHVRVSDAEGRRQISAYANAIGVNANAALSSLPGGDISLHSIALDAQFKPIPILNSDGGFALLLEDPPPAQVEELVVSMLRPFPAGLLTDAGLLVANPVFADSARQRLFDNTAYHGTVVWSWQQALMAAGLERQLARHDLSAKTIDLLRSAQTRLWAAITNARELRSSELWSWRFANGRYEPVPFGQNSGDADESNAAQLWSTVYLAIPAPVSR